MPCVRHESRVHHLWWLIELAKELSFRKSQHSSWEYCTFDRGNICFFPVTAPGREEGEIGYAERELVSTEPDHGTNPDLFSHPQCFRIR